MATDAPGPTRRQMLVWLAALVGAPAAHAADAEPLYLSARDGTQGIVLKCPLDGGCR